jgi:hypothetical protein
MDLWDKTKEIVREKLKDPVFMRRSAITFGALGLTLGVLSAGRFACKEYSNPVYNVILQEDISGRVQEINPYIDGNKFAPEKSKFTLSHTYNGEERNSIFVPLPSDENGKIIKKSDWNESSLEGVANFYISMQNMNNRNIKIKGVKSLENMEENLPRAVPISSIEYTK